MSNTVGDPVGTSGANAEQADEVPKDFDVVEAASYKQTGSAGEYEPTPWELFLTSSSCQCCCPWLCPCLPACQTQKCKCCSFCSCCTFFGVGWFFLVILFIKIAADGTGVFQTEEQQLKNDIDVRNWWGFNAAQSYVIQGCGAKTHEDKAVCDADDKCEWFENEGGGGRKREVGGECDDKQVCPEPARRKREGFLAFIYFLYEATGDDGNILDDSILNQIAKFEKKIGSTANDAISPWTDWCMRQYPAGDKTQEQNWTCAPPSSMMNLFGTNDAARASIEAGAQNGYSSLGALSCICNMKDELCDICNSDGTLKGFSGGLWDTTQLPVGHCYRDFTPAYCSAKASAMTPAPTAPNTPEHCSEGEGGLECALPYMGGLFQSICSSKTSCQWSGPGLNFLCSSNGYYFPEDHTGNLLTGAEKDKAIDKMCNEDQKSFVNFRKNMFDTEFDCTKKTVKYARTLFLAGGKDTEANNDELKKYFEASSGWFERETELEAEIESENDGKLRIMLFASPLLESQFLQLLLVDSCLSAGALLAVWLYMWYALESFFLASCGMFEIIFSLPVAMSLWAVLLQQKITFLQMLVIYMILGIGADDVFILNDAWQQSRFQGPVITKHWVRRFSWAYRRSFCAMAVTTATTCGSFVIGAVSPLPQVRDFCIFAGVVVFVDWIFCITFFASALIVYEKHFKGTSGCFRSWNCGKVNDPGKCLGPGMCWGCCRATCSLCGTNWKCIPKPPAEGEAMEPRALEKFCEGPLHKCLSGIGGKVAIAIWTVLVITSLVICAAMLRTAEKAPPIGRDNVDMTKGLEVLLNEFPNFRQPKSFAVWGLDEEEPVTYGNKNEDNEPNFKAGGAVELASKEGQMALLRLCREADKGSPRRCETRECLVQGAGQSEECQKSERIWQGSGVWTPEDTACQPGRYCFMEEFARAWAWTVDGCSSKYPDESHRLQCTADEHCQWSDLVGSCYPKKTEHDYVGLPKQEFLQLLGKEFPLYLEMRSTVLNEFRREYDAILYNEMTGYSLLDDKSGLKFAYIGWNATYAFQNTVDVANEWYDRWQGMFAPYKEQIKGFQTMELYTFRATQNEMVKGAILGIVMSLVVAFIVMLIATGNWWTTLVGLLNIMAIVALILGWMPLLGWSLGEYECIFMIATVGLSVDYTVHLLHAYNHSHEDSRVLKAKAAMGEMGVSVVSSAITTLLAASLLFACRFYFFFQFGGFIFIVILVSILMSLTFLMPLIMIIGPSGNRGTIHRCARRAAHAFEPAQAEPAKGDGKIDTHV